MSSATISEKDFHELVVKRAQTLLGLAHYLTECKPIEKTLIRPFLGELLSQSMQLEEFLDAYNARNNCRWCAFRALTAAFKHFSDVGYELLHIQHVLPAYHLLPIESNFVKATENTLRFTGDILLRAAKQILLRAEQLDLPVPSGNIREQSYSESLPSGRLPHDCGTRRTEAVSETVTLLATAFLNLAAESKDVRAASRAKPEDYDQCLANSVTEETLRNLELRFHNLQSLYDTYVSGTDVEELDSTLPVLRGHISVVFHLLKIATLFTHHYERHVNKQPCDSEFRQEPLVNRDELLVVLMNYCITHIGLYISCAEAFCHQMLKRYAEIGRVEVPIPQYRGFHVRPATLISKLVLHYGSEVMMQLDDDVYDASSTLELFRANEKINAHKRKRIASEIVRLKLVPTWSSGKDIKTIVRDVILALVEQSKLILYEQPLQLSELQEQQEGTLLEKVIDEVAQLFVLGKIDTDIDLNATFVGDKRVLCDIKLLAESGYGEDSFGNNIPLPEKLAYLRR